MNGLYFDYDGNPLPNVQEWEPLFANRFDRDADGNTLVTGPGRIAQDVLGDGLYTVSTVWLGINHSFYMQPPVLWETLVFQGESSRDVYMIRYSSREDAAAGHREVVARIQAGDLPWNDGDD